jgi:hypothetical protein
MTPGVGGVPNRTSFELHLPAEMDVGAHETELPWYALIEL